VDSRLVEAPEEDQAVARDYPEFISKGQAVGGVRLTIMTTKTRYEIGEEVRVIHVLEATDPGHELYVMGPKTVYGEYVDNELATPPPPEADPPWQPQFYDGAVEPSPGLDYNYEITAYRFSQPGPHFVRWELGHLRSNLLEIEVGR
jgi:hypothetical protein